MNEKPTHPQLVDCVDMMLDEFKRIAAICRTITARSEDAMYAVEILGLCERAVQRIPQRVPVILQRDEAYLANKELGDALERLSDALGVEGEADEVVNAAIESRVNRTGRDGNWLDEFGCCKVCDGEIPHGHSPDCDIYKLECQLRDAENRFNEAESWNGLVELELRNLRSLIECLEADDSKGKA